MEANEIMAIEEVMEPVVESAVEVIKPKANFKNFGIFGAGVLAGVGICKVVVPVIKKLVNKRKAIETTYEECGEVYTGDVEIKVEESEDE